MLHVIKQCIYKFRHVLGSICLHWYQFSWLEGNWADCGHWL